MNHADTITKTAARFERQWFIFSFRNSQEGFQIIRFGCFYQGVDNDTGLSMGNGVDHNSVFLFDIKSTNRFFGSLLSIDMTSSIGNALK